MTLYFFVIHKYLSVEILVNIIGNGETKLNDDPVIKVSEMYNTVYKRVRYL